LKFSQLALADKIYGAWNEKGAQVVGDPKGMNQPSELSPEDDRSQSANGGDPLMPPDAPPAASLSSDSIPTAMPVPMALQPPASPVGSPPPPPTASLLPVAIPPQPESPAAHPQPLAPPPARPILVSPDETDEGMVDADDPTGWGEPGRQRDVLDLAQKTAPPWIVSLAVHTSILVTLGLLFMPGLFDDEVPLEIVYAEEIGDQIEDDTFQSLEDMPDIVKPIISEDEVMVEDPFAAPPVIPEILKPFYATSDIVAPSIGMALTGREKGMKKALLAAYGGTALTEEAVVRGLEWLKRNQLKNGSWSLRGPYKGPGAQENVVAATAMALLAFQGHGSTDKNGPYVQQVARGWNFLLKLQDDSGGFTGQNVPLHHTLYCQAQATIALCELYGMTKDSRFRAPAQKAINYAVKYQGSEGGWRYTPGSDSDLSVTGWFVMGLQSGLMGGLDVPQETLDRISDYLDICTTDGGAQYGYRQNSAAKISMTAEGLLSRQYLGWEHNDPRLKRGVQVVLANPIRWENQNVYYWYYATQVMHHMGGKPWGEWNREMRQSLPEHQVKTGDERGSWDQRNDQWGQHGGRLYTTCLCIYMLEVYYRHLPIYNYEFSKTRSVNVK
jgi:hypothetical protein